MPKNNVCVIFPCRLKDYPHYCQHLASIPHFMEFPPSLIEYIEYGQQSREPLLGGRNIQVNSNKKEYFLWSENKTRTIRATLWETNMSFRRRRRGILEVDSCH